MRTFCPFHWNCHNNAKRYPFGSSFGSLFESLFGFLDPLIEFQFLLDPLFIYFSTNYQQYKIRLKKIYRISGKSFIKWYPYCILELRGDWKVDMGQYGGERGQKWPKIGDVVYGWPLYPFISLAFGWVGARNRTPIGHFRLTTNEIVTLGYYTLYLWSWSKSNNVKSSRVKRSLYLYIYLNYYSKASRYTASSCTDLAVARF